MRLFAGAAFAAMCLLAGFTTASADQGQYPQTDEARQAAYDALQWQTNQGEYKLPRSHGVIKLQSGYAALLGADAERYSWLGSGIEFPDTEAVITSTAEDARSLVYYEWRDEGYIEDSDWGDVDPDALLQQYRDGAQETNKEKVANGFKPTTIVGWLEPPHYEETTRTVTYALELKSDDGSWVNAVALRLGRVGYTEFTWVGSVDAFKSSASRPDLMNLALDTHAFEEGHRYADFAEGDKVAAYGIAGLVAAAVGAKVVGKGLIAGLIAFVIAFKKVILVAVLGFGAAIVGFFKRMFGRRGAGS